MIHRSLLLLTALSAVTGCSSIPEGEPVIPVGSGAPPLAFRLCVAPVEVTLASQEEPKGYEPKEVVRSEGLQEQVTQWVRAAAGFESVRSAAGGDRQLVLDDAWRNGDQLLLELTLEDFRVEFEGHNGWWIPNIINWLVWMIPSWWVATEEYVLSFEADLRIRSVDSLQVLYNDRFPVSVQGSFDEFDRGWQPLGFIWPFNDEDNWRKVASELLPAATSQLGRGVATSVEGPGRARLNASDIDAKMRKTVALVVGLSHYRDGVRYPPLPYAADDAHALGEALTSGCGLQPRHVLKLTGAQATRAGLQEALDLLSERLRPGDQLLFYFAGYGTRSGAGAPALLLHDADPGGQGQLQLSDLAKLLARIPAETLVLIDAGFDGRGRSVASKAPASKRRDSSALRPRKQLSAILSASPGQEVLTPQHVGAGLFSHHLTRGLKGAADLDDDGRVSLAELKAFVGTRTEAEAAFFGKTQVPEGMGLERPFSFRVAGSAK